MARSYLPALLAVSAALALPALCFQIISAPAEPAAAQTAAVYPQEPPATVVHQGAH